MSQTLQKHLELFVANPNFLRNKVPMQYSIQDDPQEDVSSGVMRAADLRLKYEAGSSICCQPHAQARLALVHVSTIPAPKK